MHAFWLGLLLGWGAAIPIGPVNLEIIRRHLQINLTNGLVFGFGACSTDLAYLSALSLSVNLLTFLHEPWVLRCFGIAGSFVLLYFAWQTFRPNKHTLGSGPKRHSLLRNYCDGVLMTAFNPGTILFWTAITSQLSLIQLSGQQHLLLAGLGVISSTVSWVVFLNAVLILTKHRLTPRMMRRLDISGGIVLIGFAIFSLWTAINA